MRVLAQLATVLALAVGPVAAAQSDAPRTAQDGAKQPLRIDQSEKATVRLVLVDVLVLDSADRTVTDLAVDDFVVHLDGRPVAVDTFDAFCSDAVDDPRAVRQARKRPPVPGSEAGRRIVFALDYQHIGWNERNEVFDHVREWIRNDMVAGDEVMIAALTGGVRVEQPFTDDPAIALGSLRRMEHDVTLWSGNFAHLNEIGWVNGVTSLLDVIEQTPGRKALVLYSTMGDVPLDAQFARIAAQAAASRCAIYPVDAAGLARGQEGVQTGPRGGG